MNSLDFDKQEDDIDLQDVDVQHAEVVEKIEEPEELNDDDKLTDDNDDDDDDDDEEIDRKNDNEIINDFLKPSARCILCTTPIWAVKLNKAFLDGESYSEMVEKFSSKFEERANRSLNKSLLSRHFKSHFDARAFAIAQYNKRRRNSTSDGLSPTTMQRDIFKLASQKYLDELEIFDTTAKELIIKYQELESLIEDKKNSGKSFGIDDLILKQAQILSVLSKQAISKFKALSKVDLESKQGQFLSKLSFIGNKALSGANDKKLLVSPQDIEEIYLNVVIRQMLARLDDPLKTLMPTISVDQKALFYRELKKSIEGMQVAINTDFEKQLTTKQQKLLTDRQDSQH